jgi:hypothetical protein
VSASVAGWAVEEAAKAAASLWATRVTLWPFVPVWALSRTVERKSVDTIILRMIILQLVRSDHHQFTSYVEQLSTKSFIRFICRNLNTRKLEL